MVWIDVQLTVRLLLLLLLLLLLPPPQPPDTAGRKDNRRFLHRPAGVEESDRRLIGCCS
jgi:hypothetical protein